MLEVLKRSISLIPRVTAGLIRLQDILKTTKGDGYKVTIRKLHSVGKNFTTMLKDIGDNNEYKMVIDCDVEQIPFLLHDVCADLRHLQNGFFF